MTDWFIEENAQKPQTLQVIAPMTFMERKDIYQESDNLWISTSRRISFDEYYLLQSIKEIKTDEAIDDYTMQLIEEGLL